MAKTDVRSFETIAKDIFENFELNQSATIYGYEMDGDELNIKGDLVIKELERLDLKRNWVKEGKNMRRKRVIPANTVGGYVAHKIFRYKSSVADGMPRVSIWRIQ